MYGGAGLGKAYYFSHSSGGTTTGNYLLPFYQLNFGKISTEVSNLEYGLGIKTGFLHASLTESGFEITDPEYVYNGLLVEPAIFLRPGGKRAKVNFKLSGSWIGALAGNDRYFPYSRVNFGVSLNIR